MDIFTRNSKGQFSNKNSTAPFINYVLPRLWSCIIFASDILWEECTVRRPLFAQKNSKSMLVNTIILPSRRVHNLFFCPLHQDKQCLRQSTRRDTRHLLRFRARFMYSNDGGLRHQGSCLAQLKPIQFCIYHSLDWKQVCYML